MTRSAKYQLIELRLGRDLEQWVTDRAADGTGCRPIARDLSRMTGMHLSHDTLRVWFPKVFEVPSRRRVTEARS